MVAVEVPSSKDVDEPPEAVLDPASPNASTSERGEGNDDARPLSGAVRPVELHGFWGPRVSSAADFLAWYERWLNRMLDGRHDPDLGLTSPGLLTPGGRAASLLRGHQDLLHPPVSGTLPGG